MNRLYIILLVLLFSCKEEKLFLEEESIKQVFLSLNDQKLNELECMCFAEVVDLEENCFYSRDVLIKKVLNIKDSLHLKEQLDLFKSFKLKTNHFPSKTNASHLNSNKEFNEICKGEYFFASKPLFNKSFNEAIIYIGYKSSPVFTKGNIYYLKLEKNDYWKIIKNIGSWRS